MRGARRAGLLVGLMLVTGACRESSAPPPAEGAAVTLAPVVVRDVEDHIEATGELVALDEATIAAEVSGRITRVLFEEGDAIESGAIILEIDRERRQLELDDARARVAETEAAVREQQREMRRIRQLHGRDVASRAQLDQAETALATARSRLEASGARLGVAERELRDASVTAPFAGRIARRRVSRGEFVQRGQALVELVALDPVEVEFHLPEIDTGRVHLGQRVDVRVAPYPDSAFTATVTVIAPVIDPRTRTLRVRAELPNPEQKLRPGLFARVDLGVNRRAGVKLIPEEAVLQRADGAVVFRIDADSRVERRVIRTGEYRGGEVEVVAGLGGGDWVVTRGHSDLVDGELVVSRNPDGTRRTPPVASAETAPSITP